MSFIPIHDTNRLRFIRWPYVSWGIILLNTLIFLFAEAGGTGEVGHASVISYGLIPAAFTDLVVRPHQLAHISDRLTLLTYAFLHADFWHLAGNMIFVWVFADNVEDSLGHVRFILFYLLCAVAGGYAYVLSDPASESPVIGASGAIAGIVAAYLILHPYAKVWILAFARIPLRISALWILGFWLLFQVVGAISDPRRRSHGGRISAARWPARRSFRSCGARACGCLHANRRCRSSLPGAKLTAHKGVDTVRRAAKKPRKVSVE